jgi:hypothetical protein
MFVGRFMKPWKKEDVVQKLSIESIDGWVFSTAMVTAALLLL